MNEILPYTKSIIRKIDEAVKDSFENLDLFINNLNEYKTYYNEHIEQILKDPEIGFYETQYLIRELNSKIYQLKFLYERDIMILNPSLKKAQLIDYYHDVDFDKVFSEIEALHFIPRNEHSFHYYHKLLYKKRLKILDRKQEIENLRSFTINQYRQIEYDYIGIGVNIFENNHGVSETANEKVCINKGYFTSPNFLDLDQFDGIGSILIEDIIDNLIRHLEYFMPKLRGFTYYLDPFNGTIKTVETNLIQQPNPIHINIGYKLPYSEEELKQIYKTLINERLIHDSTKEEDFINAFNGEPLSVDFEPIKWKNPTTGAIWFSLMTKGANKWTIANRIFAKARYPQLYHQSIENGSFDYTSSLIKRLFNIS